MSTRLRRTLANLAVLGFLGLWFVTLAPTAIGGPTAYVEVQGHSMDGTYATGDLVITRAQDTYAVGDIVVFKASSGGQVVHRIIAGDGERGWTLQGDNNPDPDPWHPTDDEVVGKAWIHLEQKAYLMHLPREPWFAGLTAGLITLVVLGWDARPRRGTAEVTEPDQAPEPVEGEPLPVPAQRSADDAARPAVRRRRLRRSADATADQTEVRP